MELVPPLTTSLANCDQQPTGVSIPPTNPSPTPASPPPPPPAPPATTTDCRYGDRVLHSWTSEGLGPLPVLNLTEYFTTPLALQLGAPADFRFCQYTWAVMTQDRHVRYSFGIATCNGLLDTSNLPTNESSGLWNNDGQITWLSPYPHAESLQLVLLC